MCLNKIYYLNTMRSSFGKKNRIENTLESFNINQEAFDWKNGENPRYPALVCLIKENEKSKQILIGEHKEGIEKFLKITSKKVSIAYNVQADFTYEIPLQVLIQNVWNNTITWFRTFMLCR